MALRSLRCALKSFLRRCKSVVAIGPTADKLRPGLTGSAAFDRSEHRSAATLVLRSMCGWSLRTFPRRPQRRYGKSIAVFWNFQPTPVKRV